MKNIFFLFIFCCREERVMGRFTGKKCRLVSMFWLTLLFFLVEIVVGYVTNSMALVADSFHMLSDVAALVVAFLSVKVSRMILCKCKYEYIIYIL
jgi:zinc transporter 1